MMNKKLIALLLAISAISSISAHYNAECDMDDDGREYCYEGPDYDRCYGDDCRGPVRRTGEFAGDVVEETGEVTGNAVKRTGRAIGRFFGRD